MRFLFDSYLLSKNYCMCFFIYIPFYWKYCWRLKHEGEVEQMMTRKSKLNLEFLKMDFKKWGKFEGNYTQRQSNVCKKISSTSVSHTVPTASYCFHNGAWRTCSERQSAFTSYLIHLYLKVHLEGIRCWNRWKIAKVRCIWLIAKHQKYHVRQNFQTMMHSKNN